MDPRGSVHQEETPSSQQAFSGSGKGCLAWGRHRIDGWNLNSHAGHGGATFPFSVGTRKVIDSQCREKTSIEGRTGGPVPRASGPSVGGNRRRDATRQRETTAGRSTGRCGSPINAPSRPYDSMSGMLLQATRRHDHSIGLGVGHLHAGWGNHSERLSWSVRRLRERRLKPGWGGLDPTYEAAASAPSRSIHPVSPHCTGAYCRIHCRSIRCLRRSSHGWVAQNDPAVHRPSRVPVDRMSGATG